MTSDAKEMADNNRSAILNNHSDIRINHSVVHINHSAKFNGKMFRINRSVVHINHSADKVQWKNVQITAQFSASWPSYDD